MKPTSAHGDLNNPGVAHETSDVDVRSILWFAAIVAIVTIVCAGVVWGVFDLLESQAAARDPKLSPLAMPAVKMSPATVRPTFGNGPEPRLETDEFEMLRRYRTGEDLRLHGYGWVDEKTGVTRLPIDQAKKLLSERGLPARAAGSEAWLGTHTQAYGESSGGRTVPTGEKPAANAPPTGGAAPEVPHAPETPKAPAPAAAGHGSGH
jgi:hypothetical protein